MTMEQKLMNTAIERKKLPVVISIWLTIVGVINLIFLQNLPIYKSTVHLQQITVSDMLHVALDPFFIIQVGFLIFLFALYLPRKWGFYGLLVVYAFAIWPALHAISSPIAVNALLLPPIWIYITYVLLRTVKIENVSVWHAMDQKKSQKEPKASSLDDCDDFHPVTRFILKGVILFLAGISFFVLFFPIPDLPLILTIKTHASLIVIIDILICLMLMLALSKFRSKGKARYLIQFGIIFFFIIGSIFFNLMF